MGKTEEEFTPIVNMDHATPTMKDLREMEERINERFDTIFDTMATKEDLKAINAKLDKLIGDSE